MRSIRSLFGTSPVAPLQELAAEATTQVDAAVAAVGAALAGDATPPSLAGWEVAEAAADALRDHLPRSVFLPVDRRDLLVVVSALEDLAEAAGGISLRCGEHAWVAPSLGAPEVTSALDALRAGVAALQRAIGQFDELVETGFAGPPVDRTLALLTEAERTSPRTLRACSGARSALFGAGLPAAGLVAWLGLLDCTEHAARHVADAGAAMRLFLAR